MASRAVLVTLLCIAVCSGTARALEVTIPVTNVTVTSVGLAGSTVRLDLGSMHALDEEMVLWAQLALPLSGTAPVTDLNLSVSGLLTSGGAPDPNEVTDARLAAGIAQVSLDVDVTDLVRSIVEGEAPNHGFLLRPSDTSRIGFNAAEMAALGSLQGGEIVVSYRKLTAYGIRGGASALAERKRTQKLDDRRRPDPEGAVEATTRSR
ncbi:MAG: hypothetical protein DHS20C21_20710 [Gemmatimonadota bacterium]|nr:MAG: hypothetical protein DHS20C21_20710 [Gemmatimonadota bacterium]